MRVFVGREVEVLKAISARPRHHLSLAKCQRQCIAKLWIAHLVRLKVGDVGEVSDRGRQLLTTNETMH